MHAKKVTGFIKRVPHIPVPTISWGPQKGLAQGPACRQIHLRLGRYTCYDALFIRGLWYGLSYEGWGQSIQTSNTIRSRIRPTTHRKYNPPASKNMQNGKKLKPGQNGKSCSRAQWQKHWTGAGLNAPWPRIRQVNTPQAKIAACTKWRPK